MCKNQSESLKPVSKNSQEGSTAALNPEAAHNIRNGLSGVYVERKRLVAEIAIQSAALTKTGKRPALFKSRLGKNARYKIFTSIVCQLGCINRMDKHLHRILKGLEPKEAA